MQQANDKGCYDDFDMAIKLDDDNASVHHHRGQVRVCFVLHTIILLIQF